nr:MAG TPA: Protein of unknown function (DUF2829) [Caudoviricetes sp.]
MTFEEALKAMREGKKVKDIFSPVIWLEANDIWYENEDGIFNYQITTGDVLSEHWEIVPDAESKA